VSRPSTSGEWVSMSDRLTSRKFLLSVLALACLTALCAFDQIDGGQYITGLIATVGAYLTANVAQKVKA
jgi:hypothetical protein